MRFDDLKLMPLLLQNVQVAGYETPTPIQQATIPLVLAGKDVLGCAQTGTGKTAAFALPIIQQLAKKPTRFGQSRAIRALILTPTRELAQQIYDNFVLYGKKLPVYPTVIFGGVNQQGQVNALHRGADVVIACPGRLWDLMNQGFVHLDKVETFVLDEADRMLDMGFIHDVRRIAEKLPEKRQTLMFSATMPPEVEKLAMDLLHEPESVKVDPVSSTVKKIDQCLYYVDKANKKHLLAKILRDPDVENALVFSRTKHGADRIVRDLKREGIDAVAIHGDKSQNARQAALTAFKTGECKVLVATDIAARGIDIAGLSHVINYDMPMEPEAYVHRIGRTGRAGRDGTAISFCCIDEVKQLGQVEKLIGKRLPLKESEWPMEITTPSEPKPRQPRPAKLTMQGNAAPERKANRPNPPNSPHPPRFARRPWRSAPRNPPRARCRSSAASISKIPCRASALPAVSAQHAAVSLSSSAETARCASAARPSASRAPRRTSLSPARTHPARRKMPDSPSAASTAAAAAMESGKHCPPPESRTIRGIFWFFTESLGEQTKASAKQQKAARGRRMKARPTLRVRRRASKLLFPPRFREKTFFLPASCRFPAKSLNPSEFFPKPS